MTQPMDLLEAIYQRRAVRHYDRREVSASSINQLCAAAVQAPSSLNQQPWAFAVFSGRDRLLGYSHRAKEHYLRTTLASFGTHERGDSLTDPRFNIFYDAGTLLVICARHRGLNPAEDCCLAAQNVMLAAHGSGLGTAPIGIARPWFNEASVKDELGIPADCAPVMVLTVGYPFSQTPPPPRNAPDILSWLDETSPGMK
jgi:nitroreductase